MDFDRSPVVHEMCMIPSDPIRNTLRQHRGNGTRWGNRSHRASFPRAGTDGMMRIGRSGARRRVAWKSGGGGQRVHGGGGRSPDLAAGGLTATGARSASHAIYMYIYTDLRRCDSGAGDATSGGLFRSRWISRPFRVLARSGPGAVSVVKAGQRRSGVRGIRRYSGGTGEAPARV